jgi:hypothetical protein
VRTTYEVKDADRAQDFAAKNLKAAFSSSGNATA